MDADKLLCIKLAEKGEHVSIGSAHDLNETMIVNLLRLGAKSVIISHKCNVNSDDRLTKFFNKKIKSYTYSNEKIVFLSKRITDDEIRIVAKKIKK